MISIIHSCNIQHVINKCIAFRNKNSKQVCSRKTILHGDYCGYHRKKKKASLKNVIKHRILKHVAGLKIYNWWKNVKHVQNAFLDRNFIEYLIMGESSWSEIPFRYQFQISSNQWWDIRFLTKHFAQLLNHNDMITPSPSFPRNPFTRELFSPSELNAYFVRVTRIQLPVNIALKKFKASPYKNWYKCLKRTSAKKKTHNQIITQKIVSFLTKSMRYKLINQSNSECSFVGHWVIRNRPLSVFEKTYRDWIKAPIYVKDPSGVLIFNPDKDFCWMKLWQIEEEFWSVDDEVEVIKI